MATRSPRLNLVERLVFPAPQPSYNIDSFPGELILIPSTQPGARVPCLFMPFRHARFIFIYFHANAEDLGICYHFCTAMRDLFQVHILAVEYPGYGICPGPCTEEGVLANASAAISFVTDTLGWPYDGVKFLGRSLGTGPSIQLATQHSVAGLILVTPFLSIREIFRFQVGKVAEFVQERFPNHAVAHRVKCPTLIIHGQQDNLIPCDHGKAIYDRVRTRKMLVCPQSMNHNSGLLQNVGDFVLPMTQFFSLPDYTFEDVEVPDWVFPQANVPKVVSKSDEPEDPLCGKSSILCGMTASQPPVGRVKKPREVDLNKDASETMMVMPPRPRAVVIPKKEKADAGTTCEALLGRARSCGGHDDADVSNEASGNGDLADLFAVVQGKDAVGGVQGDTLRGLPCKLSAGEIGVIRWHL